MEGDSAREQVVAGAGRRRIAVIGIDRYAHTQHWRRLSNAVNDARGAAALFGQLGFESTMPPPLIASIVGAPISILILDAGLPGLPGWRWLFLLEGAPAVILGLVVLAVLRDRPEQAAWLTPGERDVLSTELVADRNARTIRRPLTLWQGLREPRILLLSAICFGCAVGQWGVTSQLGRHAVGLPRASSARPPP